MKVVAKKTEVIHGGRGRELKRRIQHSEYTKKERPFIMGVTDMH